MQPTMAAVEALAIVFLLIGLGWWLGARKVVTPALMPALSAIALDVALPCLVFVVILNRFQSRQMPGWPRLPLAWIGFTLAAWPLSMLAGYAARREVRREFRLCCFYQNALFLPLALLTEMYGANSGTVAKLFMMTFPFPALFFNTYGMFFGSTRRLDWRKTLHPVLLATLAAVLLSLVGCAAWVPALLLKGMQQIGVLSVPLLMILLGARIRDDYQRRGPIYWRESMVFVGIRNAGFPLLCVAVIRLLSFDPEIGFLLLLQAAMPPVTAAPIVVERAGGNVAFASQLLVASYAAALFTIPAAIWLFGAWAGT